MVGIAFFYSCAPPDEAIPDKSINKQEVPILPRSASSVADRIYFNDFEEFEDYYLGLDTLLTFDTDIFDSIVLADSPVETINSLYQNDAEYESFLADPIMEAILNANFEFQIDDVIITYINNSQILASDASNSTLKTAIRAITKGETLDLGDIPNGAYWDRPDQIERALRIGCRCDITIERFTDWENVRVWGSCKNLVGADGDGLVTGDFDANGSAPPIEVLNEEISGNFDFLIDITSVAMYQNTGLFDGTVVPECQLAVPKYDEYFFDPAEFATCDAEHRGFNETITSGNERIKIRTSFYISGWPLGMSQHAADITSQTWNGSKWVNSKANLRVEVEANRRNLGCDFVDFKEDTENCNNCKSKVTRVGWAGATFHCNDDLIGKYRKIKSGITIEHEHSVVFMCCDE